MAAVPSMSVNTTGTVWDANDTLYPWSAWDTPGTLAVDRADAGDAGKNVIISGLDLLYNEITETVTLTAATGNTTTNSFSRVISARMNGTSTNVGVVTIARNATTVAQINAAVGQTLMGVYTVPAGYTAYLHQGVMTIETGGDATGFFEYRVPGDRFVIGHTFEVASSEYHYGFSCPLALPEKSDIDVRAAVRTNNSRVTAAYDMILIKNGGPL
jgi:hypothetical protein